MAIIRHGYREPEDTADLTRFYATAQWKATRKAVVARAGGRCEWCGTSGRLDCVHLTRSTLELVRSGDPLNVAELAAGCRKCHGGFASGRLGRPPGR